MSPLYILVYILTIVESSDTSANSSNLSNLEDLVTSCTTSNGQLATLCDPQGYLDPNSREIIRATLESSVPQTVCFCNPPCSYTTWDRSRELVIGLLLLKELPKFHQQYDSSSKLVALLRSRWNLGACRGNDIFILVIGSSIHLDYGPLVQKRLIPTCLQSLPTTYEIKSEPGKRIRLLITTLRSLLMRTCLCGRCSGLHLSIKIVTILLASVCLLTWLRLLARRAYFRRTLTIRPHQRGPYMDVCALPASNLGRMRLRYPPRPRLERVQTNAGDENAQTRRSSGTPDLWQDSSQPDIPPPPYSSVVKPSDHQTAPNTTTDSADYQSSGCPPPYSEVIRFVQPQQGANSLT